jgi:hypothetical protein
MSESARIETENNWIERRLAAMQKQRDAWTKQQNAPVTKESIEEWAAARRARERNTKLRRRLQWAEANQQYFGPGGAEVAKQAVEERVEKRLREGK